MKNVAKNFYYQGIYQILKIIMPIITIPIVSNAFGPTGIGEYNYANSIVQYFILFASLGVGIYGNREIAVNRQYGKYSVSKVFWEIFYFKAIITTLSLVLYILFVLFAVDNILLTIQIFNLASVLFDISWLFMGVEDFKKTSLSNLFVQIIVFILIITLVKDKNDLVIYTLIQTIGILLSQIIVWLFLKEYVQKVKVTLTGILSHFKGSIKYFIPQVSILLYTNLNKTILGFFVGASAVGIFSNSLQLNNIFITLITTVDMVLLPHMSKLYSQGDETEIVHTMKKTIHLQLYFTIALFFGILTVFDKLVPWFFGEKFLLINQVIPVFAILTIIVPLGMAVSRQYLMPIGKINAYNYSVVVGAIINIIANLCFLPFFGFWGVVAANILAEFFVTFTRVRQFLKETSFSFNIKQIVLCVISGLIMCIVTRFITREFAPNLLANIIQVIIAVPFYFLFTLLFKCNGIVNLLKKK